MNKHPAENMLALYAGGDLDLVERIRVTFHVRGCEACGRQVAHHRMLRADLQSVRERTTDPLGDWDRLSDEMTANIRLGLSMAECVGPLPKDRHKHFTGYFWKPPVMASAALVLFATAFFINMPLDRIQRLWQGRDHSGLILESTLAGIEMRRDGRAVITVRHPDRKSPAVAANLDGSMSAGYVDDETGQVTIINVAGQ